MEAAASAYLLAPAIIFFLGFVRIEIAIPSVLFLGWFLTRLAARTRWRVERPLSAPIISSVLVALLLVVFSGAGGWLMPPSDWNKHYAVLNFLSARSWPPVAMTVDGDTESLRYALGWYLVPSLATKLFGLHGSNLVAAGWSATGILIFSGLLFKLIAPGPLRCLAPAVFFLFSGCDLLGSYWSGFQENASHIEWWAGWVAIGSNMSSMLWTPQHALPAWIAVALLLLHARQPSSPDFLAVIFFGVLLWSPFAAIGLVPVGLAFCWQTRSLRIAFNWTALAAAILIGAPLFAYLTAGSADIPHGFIWNTPCVINKTFPDAPCFSWPSYGMVLLLEVVPYFVLALVLLPSWRRFTIVAGIALAVLPLYRFGEWSDLAMRSSIPLLAVFAIAVAKILAEKRFVSAFPVLVVLGFGVPTAAYEVNSTFRSDRRPIERSSFANINNFDRYRNQYFAAAPARVLRSNADTDAARRAVSCRLDTDLTSKGDVGSNLLIGMGTAEPMGRWTVGDTAVFACLLPEGFDGGTVEVEASAFAPSTGTERVVFRVNEAVAVTENFPDGVVRLVGLPLPRSASKAMRLTIETPEAASPKSLGMSDDARKLGLMIRSIRVR